MRVELKLQRLIIRDIRTFEGEHSLSLHDSLTVIVGKNNAGKSTLLEAMYVVGASEAGTRLGALERVRGRGGYAALSGEVTPGELIAHARDLPGHFLRLTQANIEGFKLVTATYDQSGAALITAEMNAIAITGREITRSAKNGDWTSVRPSPGDPDQWEALYRLIRGDAMSRVAAWSHFGVTRHGHDPKTRLLGSEEEDLRRALVFLRLCHPNQFDLLEEELTATFPEFEQISFVDDRQNDTWEPRFKIRGREQTNVARNSELERGHSSAS